MSNQDYNDLKIPVLQDVVIPVDQASGKSEEKQEKDSQAPLLSSTLQQEVDTIIEKARADFDAAIQQALSEMQQRIERELNELHVHLTKEE